MIRKEIIKKNIGNCLNDTSFLDLPMVQRGKVRDIYAFDDKLLIVATDRMSAFDVVMDDPIPDKGRILTSISIFWFTQLASIVENHIISTNPGEYPDPCQKYRENEHKNF